MRKVYKRKKRACALCKPWKRGKVKKTSGKKPPAPIRDFE